MNFANNWHPWAITLWRSKGSTAFKMRLLTCINLLVKSNRANLHQIRWGNNFIAGGVAERARCGGYWPACLRGGVWAPCFIWIMDELCGARFLKPVVSAAASRPLASPLLINWCFHLIACFVISQYHLKLSAKALMGMVYSFTTFATWNGKWIWVITKSSILSKNLIN